MGEEGRKGGREGGKEGRREGEREIIHKKTPSGNDDDIIELQSDITY